MPEEKRSFSSGATSTKQVRLSLIPHAGLVNVAKRFEVGIEVHGDGAYNALRTETHTALKDAGWLIERCSHAIEHLYCIIDELVKNGISEKILDDAGAVGWAGVVLGEAATGKTPGKQKQPTIYDICLCGHNRNLHDSNYGCLDSICKCGSFKEGLLNPPPAPTDLCFCGHQRSAHNNNECLDLICKCTYFRKNYDKMRSL